MRLIFDEDLPSDLLPHFESEGHEVVHVEELGWKGIRNSELLARTSAEYDVLITGDTNMRYQQNLARYQIAVVVLQPRVKVLEQLIALVPDALAKLPVAPVGQATIIRPE